MPKRRLDLDLALTQRANELFHFTQLHPAAPAPDDRQLSVDVLPDIRAYADPRYTLPVNLPATSVHIRISILPQGISTVKPVSPWLTPLPSLTFTLPREEETATTRTASFAPAV